MKISVITVVFNGAETIEDTIRSVLSQHHPDLEYIVIDGGSTDQTMNIVNRYKDKIDVIVSETDGGMYDAMNKGIAKASGEVIGFLNADDVYAHDNVLSTVADVLTDKNIDGCYADLLYVRRDDLTNPVRYWRSGERSANAFSNGWMPAHPTFYARAEVYRQYGGFNLNYQLAADVELLIRLMGRYAIRTRYIPEIFVKMRMGGVSNKRISVVIKQNIAIYRALKENGLSCSYLFLVRKLIKRVKQFQEGLTYGSA